MPRRYRKLRGDTATLSRPAPGYAPGSAAMRGCCAFWA